MNSLKTCLKWPGSKNQSRVLLESYIRPLTFKSYIEPFCGSLALFLHLVNIGKITKDTIVILNDINLTLINFYKDIKDNSELLIDKVKEICKTDIDYYQYRKRFNEIKNTIKNTSTNTIEISALLLYLNKSCFNGLYRENKKGEFNSASNKKKYIISRDEIKNIKNISIIFNTFNITLKSESYEKVINQPLNSQTLLYLDPPYYPIKKMSFVDYTNSNFNFTDFFKNINSINVPYIICSNSFCKTVIDNCNNFIIDKIDSKRKINCNGDDRKCKELIIMNFMVV